MSSLVDKIWLTSKARMISEKRYRRYDITSHLFLAYMSLLIIFASIFGEYMESYVPYFYQVNVILSIFVFSATLIVYGFRFSETAARHRECYLKLQHLVDRLKKLEDPESEYHNILLQYPNHSDGDYDTLIINKTLFSNEKITSSGNIIKWNLWMLLKYLMRWALFVSIVASPPILVSILFFPPIICQLVCAE